MKKRIPMKTLYLIAIITVGLISLGVGSTYAMFKAEIIIDEPIYLTSNLSYASDIMETVDVTVSPGETKHVILNITNNHNSDLAYIVWYINEGLNIDFGTEIGENSYGCTTMCSGVPVGSDPIEVGIYIRNNESTSVSVTIGISGSVGNVVLSNNMVMIPNQELPVGYTDISNFTYVLGRNTTINNINYYDATNDNYYDVTLNNPITISSNEILLTKYIGTSSYVKIPNTYTIGGLTYDVVVLSLAISTYNGNTLNTGAFIDNNIITDVIFSENIKFISYDYNGGNPYGSASWLFEGCTSLVNAPVLPNTVDFMYLTFKGCTSLEKVYDFPDSLSSLNLTFQGCSSLTTVPEIPSTVTNMSGTFWNCTSLENSPVIPTSVTTMSMTFNNCTNLKGIVTIESANISLANNAFTGTSKDITVNVPAGTTSSATFSALTVPNNVQIIYVE